MEISGKLAQLYLYTFGLPVMRGSVAVQISSIEKLRQILKEKGTASVRLPASTAMFVSLCIWTNTDVERLELYMQHLRDRNELPQVPAGVIEDYAASFAAWRNTFPSQDDIDRACFSLIFQSEPLCSTSLCAGFTAIAEPRVSHQKFWSQPLKSLTLSELYPEIQNLAQEGLHSDDGKREALALVLREGISLFLKTRVEPLIAPIIFEVPA